MNQLTTGYFYYFGISSMFLLGIVCSYKLIQAKVGCEFKMKQLLLSKSTYSSAGKTVIYSYLVNPSRKFPLYQLKKFKKTFQLLWCLAAIE